MIKLRGQIFIMSILVLSTVLVAGLVLITIFTKDLRQSVETSLSVKALYAADSAMEWQLYLKFNPGGPSKDQPQMDNSTAFEFATTTEKIQTMGIAGNVRRALETNF